VVTLGYELYQNDGVVYMEKTLKDELVDHGVNCGHKLTHTCKEGVEVLVCSKCCKYIKIV